MCSDDNGLLRQYPSAARSVWIVGKFSHPTIQSNVLESISFSFGMQNWVHPRQQRTVLSNGAVVSQKVFFLVLKTQTADAIIGYVGDNR